MHINNKYNHKSTNIKTHSLQWWFAAPVFYMIKLQEQQNVVTNELTVCRFMVILSTAIIYIKLLQVTLKENNMGIN